MVDVYQSKVKELMLNCDVTETRLLRKEKELQNAAKALNNIDRDVNDIVKGEFVFCRLIFSMDKEVVSYKFVYQTQSFDE